MIEGFQGNNKLNLQKNDVNVGYRFSFSISSSATSNDGTLPYETTISSAVVQCFSSEDEDTPISGIVSNTTSGDDYVNITMTHGGKPAGLYYLVFIITLSDSSIMSIDFGRLIIE